MIFYSLPVTLFCTWYISQNTKYLEQLTRLHFASGESKEYSAEQLTAGDVIIRVVRTYLERSQNRQRVRMRSIIRIQSSIRMFLTIRSLLHEKNEVEKRGAAIRVLSAFGHKAAHKCRMREMRRNVNALRCRDESAAAGKPQYIILLMFMPFLLPCLRKYIHTSI